MSSLLITCRNKSSVGRHYVPAVRAGGWEGGILLVAPGDPVPPLEEVRGVLLTGGDDIHPSNWDPAEPVHPEAGPDPDRDALEIPLARRAWDLGLPILGICRGEQLLNVALGGSLVQDIPDHYGCEPERHQVGSSSLPPQLAHWVIVDPGSRLRTLVGAEAVEVNSRHHQAVMRLAPGLRAVAWHGTAREGRPLVEGVEAADASRWVVAVQWHPENLVAMDHAAARSALGIFRGFAAALRERS
ncbi:gamma-glutamyl-gamma-aminobutyrate hydrolase family protein [Mesoterricola silvestris]|uniref:Gamma-glutamyl-gamma-aminobutyrate hydrolase n=1 Tax=Mesoterricola silvestris TaxID=2927979 RepID=A0AA48GZP3_9BACT|nr:gamma-glutamyl-gamma-aminobutyrate hydrolase family protein [Mesoterricola silvestris]BDU74806.1 gamma-glutamyl-gamma-aminobutyrate hydrolase [Mesoterricola silvestris]